MKFWINEKKGEITAFLSLILLLILSLVGTVIEGARLCVAKAYASRALITSMDSVLGEYYYPIYDDYHLFFLDGGYGTNEIDLEQITEIMEEYMNFSLNPTKEYNLLGQSITMPSMNLYDISIDKLSIDDTIGAADFENKMFIHEAVAFMKYKMPANLIEMSGEKHATSETSVQVSEIMERKMNLEESACTLSESMLDLIRYIEGISVDKKGIHYKNNLIKAEKGFVKQFCIDNVDMNSLVISHQVVFDSLKSSYKTPLVWLDEIIQNENNIQTFKEQIESLMEQLNSISAEDEDSEALIRNILSRISDLESKKVKALQDIKSKVGQLIELTEGTQSKIDDALEVIPSIAINQEKASAQAKSYEDYLGDNKKDIEQNLYDELEKDSIKIKNYINNLGEKTEYNLSQNRLDTIQSALTHNNQLLDQVYGIDGISINESQESISQMISFATNLKEILSTYNLKDLWFDYSSLKIDPNVKNPVTHYKKLIQQGVLNLVVKETSDISNNKITGDSLPSSLEGKQEIKNIERDLSNNISDCDEEGFSKDLKSSFGEFASEGKKETEKVDDANELLELILLNEYMLEHYKNQSNKWTQNIIRDSVLEYEQEYILNGNLKDYDNFTDMVYKLLFARTIMNLVYLYTDSEKSGLAYATAASLVGFTCLEPLISLTKTVILLVWAYEEALVDTCGLLENKYIPFMKTKTNFLINYNELLLMNKKLTQEKITKLSDKKVISTDMNYDDYIRIFMFLLNQDKKCNRAMDLIQENIRAKYEENFLFKNCIFGYKAKADFYIGAKFIKLPFVNKILNSDVVGYKYSITTDYSY